MATCQELLDQHLGLLLAYDENNSGAIETEDVTEATGDFADGRLSDRKTNLVIDAWEQLCEFDPTLCQPVIDTYLDTLQLFDSQFTTDGQINSEELAAAETEYNNGNLQGDQFRAVLHANQHQCTFPVPDTTEPTPEPTPEPSGAIIEITSFNVPDEICRGQDFDASFEVENTGDSTSNPIELRISEDGEVVATSEISEIDPGDTKFIRGTLTQDEPDSTTVTVSAVDNTDSSITAEDTREVNSLNITAADVVLEVPDLGCPGSSVSVTYAFTNDSNCESFVTFDINGEQIDRRVESGERESVTVELDMPDEDLVVDASLIVQTGDFELDSRSATVKLGQVESIVSDVSFSDTADIGENIEEASITITGDSRCADVGRAELIDRDTEDVLASEEIQIGGQQEETLNFDILMPPRVFRGLFRVTNTRTGEVQDGLTTTVQVLPRDAVIIRTDEGVDMWGGDDTSVDYKGFMKGRALKPENTESGDTTRIQGVRLLFDYIAESQSRDRIASSKIDRLSINSSRTVTFVVDGTIQGEGTTYALQTGIIGAMGVLRPNIIKSITDPSDEESVPFLG